MAAETEHVLLVTAHAAGGVVLISVLGLAGYIGGGFFALSLEILEPTYPFLKIDRDPILNLLFLIGGVGMVIASLPLLLLASIFSQDSVNVVRLLLSWLLGTLGLAVTKLSLPVVTTLLR